MVDCRVIFLTSELLSISCIELKAFERSTPASWPKKCSRHSDEGRIHVPEIPGSFASLRMTKQIRPVRSRNTSSSKYIKYEPRWHLSLKRTEAHELFRVFFIFMKPNYAFIDGQNLYLGTAKSEIDPWMIDLARFKVYLRDKYKISRIYYFLGYVTMIMWPSILDFRSSDI